MPHSILAFLVKKYLLEIGEYDITSKLYWTVENGQVYETP